MQEEKAISFSIRDNLLTFILLLLLAYFSYHVISGDRGLLALRELSKKVEDSQKKLDTANSEKMELEHKVSLLKDNSLDLDMLEEQARRLLGYIGKDEKVYPIEKK